MMVKKLVASRFAVGMKASPLANANDGFFRTAAA
jgi:hypothetical protein